MALMSEFQKERDAVLKNGTVKQKIIYIWDYYKWHIIIPIIVIIAITSHIINVITAPDIIMNGVLLNVYNTETSISNGELLEAFYQKQKIDPKEEEINLNTNLYFSPENANGNYETLQVLMAWHAADSLDFIGGDLPTLTELSYRGYFSDLREVLTEEQITKYEPYFLYMDQDFYIKRSEKIDNLEDVSQMSYPDATKPEEMVDPIPVLIDMRQSEKMTELYGESSEFPAAGITANVTNKESTLDFIDYLFE